MFALIVLATGFSVLGIAFSVSDMLRPERETANQMFFRGALTAFAAVSITIALISIWIM